MFRTIFICIALAIFSFAVLCSCGSSWSIEGNNMTIIKVDRDTIAPAGCYIMLPDSLK